MCGGTCNGCSNTCKHTGAAFDFLGVSSGDSVSSVLANIMSYMEASTILSSTQGESGIVLYDGTEYTTPGTVSNIQLDLQNMSDGDTYVLEFIIHPNYTNTIFKVLGLAVELVSKTITLATPHKVVLTISKDGSDLIGDYTIISVSGTNETFEGTFTNSSLLANNTLALNITGTHAVQTVNVSKVRSISLKFFKKLV